MAKKETKTLVLLDAHAILHRAYHALPDFSSPSGEPTGALYGVVSMLLKIIEDLKPDYLAACYDLPEPTYRHHAFSEYKAGRAKTDESLVAQIERSRDIMAAFGIPIYEYAGFEADDMLGTIVEQVKDDKNLTTIIASGDMDTFQLIKKKQVQVYMQRKGSEVVLYDEAAIKKKFGFGPLLTIDYKGIRGDASDNIPGVPGVGETSALKLVNTFGTIEKIYTAIKKSDVETVAEKAGIQKRFVQLVADHEEEALFSKDLATIRRDAPINFSLPKDTWRERVVVEDTLNLFSELGFRTLATRVKQVFDIAPDAEMGTATDSVDEYKLKQAAVMLWLLESDRTNPTLTDVLEYGRAYFKTETFADTYAALEKALETQELTAVFKDIETPLIVVIDEINATGIKLDTVYLKDLSKTLHAEITKLEKRIYTQVGEEFNLNSPKQLGVALFDTLGLKPKNQKKTATGQRSTRESELEKMRDEHPIIVDILRYRELAKLTSTYVDSLPQQIGKDGRIHTTLLQTGTTTGRMASKDPNLQNIPIRTKEGKDVRRAFVATRGYTLVSMDYSQIELRIAAILSEDEKMLDIFRSGQDVHQGVASQVFGVAPTEVTSEMRRRAKVINFGILYGMGVNALRQNLGADTSREEAQQFLEAYFNTFTRLAEYLEETKAYARQHGYTLTLFGRRRHFPGIQSGAPFIRAAAERMAINAPVQGTAADVMRIAMNDVAAHIKTTKAEKEVRILLQVHDELLFEVKTTALKTQIPKLQEIMESALAEKDTHGVPILVDVATGNNWRDLKDWK
ncbi:MAG: DNA polymerase [Candidatus Paceibacterota bacterium]